MCLFSSARPAVLLTLTRNRRIVIRTREPDQLCAVIRARGAAVQDPGAIGASADARSCA